MRKSWAFSVFAIAFGAAAAIAWTPTAAMAVTCGSGDVTVSFTTFGSPGTETCDTDSGSVTPAGTSLSDYMINTYPTYGEVQNTSYTPGVTSNTFGFYYPGYTNFIIGLEGHDSSSSNTGWIDILLPSVSGPTAGQFQLSGPSGSAVTNLIIYAENYKSIGSTPLPSALVLFASVLLGAWGVGRWRKNRRSNYFAAAA